MFIVKTSNFLPLKCKLLHTVLYISTLSLYNCTDTNFLWPIVVISWLKTQRPKFNAYILNLKGPKKVSQGPKFGPGAHGLDNPAISYTIWFWAFTLWRQWIASSCTANTSVADPPAPRVLGRAQGFGADTPRHSLYPYVTRSLGVVDRTFGERPVTRSPRHLTSHLSHTYISTTRPLRSLGCINSQSRYTNLSSCL